MSKQLEQKNDAQSMIQSGDHVVPSVTISASIDHASCGSTVQATIPLRQKLRAFLRPAHLKLCDRSNGFRLDAEDRIVAELGQVREIYALERITQVVRTIQFMDATGLVPTSQEIYGRTTISKSQRLPGQDHATTWCHPQTGAMVLLDEPYGYVDEMYRDRKSWAKRHGFGVHRLDYQGTYRPGCGIVCDLVFPEKQEKLVQNIIERIEKLDSLPKIEDLGRTNRDV
jgi:hypothetical protein